MKNWSKGFWLLHQKLEGIRKRYIDRFRQNRMFQNKQRQFYRELNQEGESCDDDQLDAEELKKFWGHGVSW